MSKFKAGDLALVVGAIERPEDVGLAVMLVEFVQAGGTPKSEKWDHAIHDEDEPAWLVEHGDDTASYKRERHLMPLRGDVQPEQQKAKEVSV